MAPTASCFTTPTMPVIVSSTGLAGLSGTRSAMFVEGVDQAAEMIGVGERRAVVRCRHEHHLADAQTSRCRCRRHRHARSAFARRARRSNGRARRRPARRRPGAISARRRQFSTGSTESVGWSKAKTRPSYRSWRRATTSSGSRPNPEWVRLLAPWMSISAGPAAMPRSSASSSVRTAGEPWSAGVNVRSRCGRRRASHRLTKKSPTSPATLSMRSKARTCSAFFASRPTRPLDAPGVDRRRRPIRSSRR